MALALNIPRRIKQRNQTKTAINICINKMILINFSVFRIMSSFQVFSVITNKNIIEKMNMCVSVGFTSYQPLLSYFMAKYTC